MILCTATRFRFILIGLNKNVDLGEPVEGAVAVGKGLQGVASRSGFSIYLVVLSSGYLCSLVLQYPYIQRVCFLSRT